MIRTLFVTCLLSLFSDNIKAVHVKKWTDDSARKIEAKKDRRIKIACIGDSATFGFGVDKIERIKEDSWPM